VPADHYTVLGVERTASPAEITRAYHRLVRRHHPDAHHAERAAYDRHHPAPSPPPPPPAPRTPDRHPLIRVGPVRYHGPRWPPG
jgi:hypothetical protein